MRNIYLLVLSMWAGNAAADNVFHEYATTVIEGIWQKLDECGLKRLDGFDPSLPRPQVPADEAIVNEAGRLLAYTYMRFGGDAYALAFKNPNGGMAHTVAVDEEDLKFVTPYAGTVARGHIFYTPAGRSANLWCRSTRVDSEHFDACVEHHFTQVIVDNLCN